MFIRQCYRIKDGKRHGYWALVESYRTARGPRQRVVSYLGQVDESLRHGVRLSAAGRNHQRMLSDKINDDRLYRALDKLLPHKQALEIHLRERMGQLFSLEYARFHNGRRNSRNNGKHIYSLPKQRPRSGYTRVI